MTIRSCFKEANLPESICLHRSAGCLYARDVCKGRPLRTSWSINWLVALLFKQRRCHLQVWDDCKWKESALPIKTHRWPGVGQGLRFGANLVSADFISRDQMTAGLWANVPAGAIPFRQMRSALGASRGGVGTAAERKKREVLRKGRPLNLSVPWRTSCTALIICT